jgi:hypothetical protein
VIAAARAWLAAGNAPGVATRRMTAVSFTKAWLLLDWLTLTQPTERAVQLGEPLLIFVAAALGIYISGRTVQARGAQPPAPAPTPVP